MYCIKTLISTIAGAIVVAFVMIALLLMVMIEMLGTNGIIVDVIVGRRLLLLMGHRIM